VEWQKAILIDPDYAVVYYDLGAYYLEMKDKSKAKEYLNRFQTLEPNSALSKNVRNVLKNIDN